MSGRLSATAFSIPGYDVPDAFQETEASDTRAEPYKIAPAIWMIIFLVLGYVGLRVLIED
jgi:hypothetical protein